MLQLSELEIIQVAFQGFLVDIDMAMAVLSISEK